MTFDALYPKDTADSILIYIVSHLNSIAIFNKDWTE